MEHKFYNYLTPSNSDKDWGVYINVAGYAEIKPGAIYPPRGHPSGYYFTWDTGRKEYYSGFQGSFTNQHIMSKYSQYLKEPVVYIGFREKILDIYNKLIEKVKEKRLVISKYVPAYLHSSSAIWVP